MFFNRPFVFSYLLSEKFFAHLEPFFVSCLPFFCCPDAAFLFAKF
ncbi:hypothetical protein B4096_0537 [Heyndrickxia coagulans]|nr:hypothetical protein B4096_0537 [Heyndrickxia coagulans]